MWVQMFHYISGGRPDGSQWPGAGGLLEVSDDEGESLIQGGNAKRAAAPPRPAEEPVKSVLKVAPPPEELDQIPAPPGYHAEPVPSDPKPAWVEWAVHQGADRDEALQMTKAELQATYGGRLLDFR